MDQQRWDKFMLFLENSYPGQKLKPMQYAELYYVFKAGYEWGARDKEKEPLASEEEQTEPRFLGGKKLRAGYD